MNLAFNSKEVKQSLFNYFILYLKNWEKTKTLFRFTTNTGISKNEKLLRAWYDNPKLQDDSLLDAILKKIKELLRKEINNRKGKKLGKKGINQSEIGRIKSATDDLFKFCNDRSSLEEFVKTITWEFLELDPETAVEKLNAEIDELLHEKTFCDRSIYTLKAVFLSEVYKCSQQSKEEDRLLSNQKLKHLLKKTDEDFQKHVDRSFIKSIGFLDNLVDQKIKNSYDNLAHRISTIERVNANKKGISVLPKMLTLNPASYGKEFYGHDELSKEFLNKLNSHKRIGLWGKSGTGKSLFLQNFIEKNKDRF